MSSDPIFDLQAAIVPYLRADPGLNGLINGRVYDAVSPDAEFPYVSLGPATVTTQEIDCGPTYDVELVFDVWARGSGNAGTFEAARPQMQRVTGTLRQALHEAALTLESHRLLELCHEETLYLRTSDGLTAQATMTFRALVDET